jgi:hypothetical protein
VELLYLRKEKLVGESFMWKGEEEEGGRTRDLSLLLKHGQLVWRASQEIFFFFFFFPYGEQVELLFLFFNIVMLNT